MKGEMFVNHLNEAGNPIGPFKVLAAFSKTVYVC